MPKISNTSDYINNYHEKSSEQELSEDLCEILTVFSARLHGRRSHKNIAK